MKPSIRSLRLLLAISAITFGKCFSWQANQWKERGKPAFLGAILATSCWANVCWADNNNKWELMNGSVQLNDPVVIGTASYRNPELIGVGGGGAVFSFQGSKTLLKVSWDGSSKSVERECRTLQSLEKAQVEAAERCLGSFPYDQDRVMILVEPYVPDAVASVMEVPDPSARIHAVKQIARTLVQMLAANIVTIDVQPLISRETGQVIFIDMTEAEKLSPPYSFLDKTLISSFTTEMITVIPEQYLGVAKAEALKEVKRLLGKDGQQVLSDDVMEILQSQLDFFSDG